MSLAEVIVVAVVVAAGLCFLLGPMRRSLREQTEKHEEFKRQTEAAESELQSVRQRKLDGLAEISRARDQFREQMDADMANYRRTTRRMPFHPGGSFPGSQESEIDNTYGDHDLCARSHDAPDFADGTSPRCTGDSTFDYVIGTGDLRDPLTLTGRD